MRMPAALFLTSLVLITATPRAQVAAPAAARPAPLYSTAAAFDSARGRLVVFGGFGGGRYSGDTWEWDGAVWSRIPAPGPAPRNSPVMVFDSKRKRMVMFGGDTRQQIFGDTWAYDGRAWTKLADTGPAPRSTHRLAYDSARDRVVLFGGFTRRLDNGAPAEAASDTWEFDGTAWTRVSITGPAGRMLQAFAYDPSTRKVVMFGGGRIGTPGQPPAPADTLGDTWEWDGARWTEVAGAAPPPRDHVSMAYDAAGKRLIMTGGHRPGGGQLDDVWQRAGARWSRVEAANTPALAAHHVLYDAKSSRVMLFGGFGPGEGPNSNLWAFTSGGWTLMR